MQISCRPLIAKNRAKYDKSSWLATLHAIEKINNHKRLKKWFEF